jgi:hypothetical protein
MSTTVKVAFRPDIVVLEIARLTLLKEIGPAIRRDQKYKQIATSLEHVGLIEPIVVFSAGRGKYLVLDGHKRLDILKARGITEACCLLATDDESYTYNKRVNYLSPIGEHHMILKALTHGVAEDRMAAALDVDVATIRRKRNLLNGICPDAVEILKDKRVSSNAFAVLRRMKPARQIEVSGLMVAADNYSRRFAQALLFGTRADFLIEPAATRATKGADPTQKAMLEQETDALLREFKAVEKSYGADILTLGVCCRYLDRMVGNARVQRYLLKRYPDVLQQLQQLLADVNDDKSRSSKMPDRKAPMAEKLRSSGRAQKGRAAVG